MKVFVAVLFLCTTSFAPSIAQGDEKNYYSRRYDSIDVNTIFRSSRLLNNYVDCLLDKKPCPPEGKDLKSKRNEGAKCNLEFRQQQRKRINEFCVLWPKSASSWNLWEVFVDGKLKLFGSMMEFRPMIAWLALQTEVFLITIDKCRSFSAKLFIILWLLDTESRDCVFVLLNVCESHGLIKVKMLLISLLEQNAIQFKSRLASFWISFCSWKF